MDDKDIRIGDAVRLRPKHVRKSLGEIKLRGGEGRIVEVLGDTRGPYYKVELEGSGRFRFARRSDLVLHRRRRANGDLE